MHSGLVPFAPYPRAHLPRQHSANGRAAGWHLGASASTGSGARTLLLFSSLIMLSLALLMAWAQGRFSTTAHLAAAAVPTVSPTAHVSHDAGLRHITAPRDTQDGPEPLVLAGLATALPVGMTDTEASTGAAPRPALWVNEPAPVPPPAPGPAGATPTPSPPVPGLDTRHSTEPHATPRAAVPDLGHPPAPPTPSGRTTAPAPPAPLPASPTPNPPVPTSPPEHSGRSAHHINPSAPAPTHPERPSTTSSTAGNSEAAMPDQPADGPAPVDQSGAPPAPLPTPPPGPGSPAGSSPAPVSPDGAPVSGFSPWDKLAGLAADSVTGWLSSLASGAVKSAAGLAGPMLAGPSPSMMTQLQTLWSSTRDIANAIYVLLVIAAGVLLMGHGSVQTRYSVKELAPRVVLGFAASNLSWFVISNAITLAAALPAAIALDSWNPGRILADEVHNALAGGAVYLVLLALADAVLLFTLLIVLIVVTFVLAILIVAAPLALCCHALPGLDAIARGWWRAMFGVLAIPTVQALIFAAVVRILLTPGNFSRTFPGLPSVGGLFNTLAVLAALYLMCRVPGWILRLTMARPGTRSIVGRLARVAAVIGAAALTGGTGAAAVVGAAGTAGAASTAGSTGAAGAGRVLGAFGARSRGLGALAKVFFGFRRATSTTKNNAHNGAGGAADPYARVRRTSDGQYLLPLPGLRRVPRTARQSTSAGRSARDSGRSDLEQARGRRRKQGRAQTTDQARGRSRGGQLELPLVQGWPEQRPVLRPDGQYALPIPATKTVARAVRGGGPARGSTGASTRADAASATRSTAARGRSTGRNGRGRQLALPADGEWPENRSVWGRDGQSRLPIPATRTPRRPTPGATDTARSNTVGTLLKQAKSGGPRPSPAPRPGVGRARQLTLPLDLPTPARSTGTPRPGAPTTPPAPAPKPTPVSKPDRTAKTPRPDAAKSRATSPRASSSKSSPSKSSSRAVGKTPPRPMRTPRHPDTSPGAVTGPGAGTKPATSHDTTPARRDGRSGDGSTSGQNNDPSKNEPRKDTPGHDSGRTKERGGRS